MNDLPKYRGEPSMANGDETALSVWDMSTPEGREAAQVFYDLQDALARTQNTSFQRVV